MSVELAEIGHVHANIDEAFVSFLGELSNPRASETAEIEMRGGGKFGYSYADLPGIMAEVRPIAARHQLAISQPVRSDGDSLVIETRVLHVSGGFISSGTLIVRMPPNPQQTGSTITYLRRYQVCALLGIAADEDDDGRAASPITQPRKRTTKRSDSPAQQRVDRSTGEIEQPATNPVAVITDSLRRQIMAMFSALGLNGVEQRTARLAYTSNAIGREITTTNEITRDEAHALIEQLIVDTSPPDEYAATGDYS